MAAKDGKDSPEPISHNGRSDAQWFSDDEEATGKQVDRQDLQADHGQQGDDIKVKGGAGKPAQDGKGDFAVDALGVRWVAPHLVTNLLLAAILLAILQLSSSTSAILRNIQELDQKVKYQKEIEAKTSEV